VLFAVVGYIAIATSDETEPSDFILSWQFLAPMSVMIVAIFLGAWYTPQQRKRFSFAASGIIAILLIATMMGVPVHAPWLLSMGAIATVIIECAAVFLPLKSDTPKGDASKV
jgi:MFS-type transporter involved in bile tolerance (Atg22 family)